MLAGRRRPGLAREAGTIDLHDPRTGGGWPRIVQPTTIDDRAHIALLAQVIRSICKAPAQAAVRSRQAMGRKSSG